MNKRGVVAAVAIGVLLGGLALFLSWRTADPAAIAGPRAEAPPQPQLAIPGAKEVRPAALPAPTAEERVAEAPRAEGEAPPALEASAPVAPGEVPPAAPAPGATIDPAGSGGTPEKPAADESRASISKDEVRSAVRAVLPRVKECYEGALGRDPSLAGKVVVRFEIEARDGKGRVVSGEVPDSETRSPFFEACVLERVAGAEFPAPAGEGKVTVSYPFTFDPGGGFGGAASEK